MLHDQFVYSLIPWSGSDGRDITESEKLKGSTTVIRKVLTSLIMQQRDHFIHQIITLREEFICAIFGCLINLNIPFLAQA
jgi:hypothetical protein